jgi:Ankyrin repeats (3 copies)
MIQTEYIDEPCHQTTAFLEVCRDEEQYFVPIIYMLLKHGADINIQNSDGDTVLHTILGDNHNFVQFLLHGCHADYLLIKKKDGETAWDVACRNKYVIHHNMEKKRIQQIYSSLLFCNHPTKFLCPVRSLSH